MVPRAGLEPARLSAPGSKPGAAAITPPGQVKYTIYYTIFLVSSIRFELILSKV